MNAPQDLRPLVHRVVGETPILDVHTHLFTPQFADLLLWGIDELIAYHYLVAEVFQAAPLKYDEFWAMPKTEQADLIWKQLFLERSPLSEACRGVLTCLQAFGLDLSSRNLDGYREYFASKSVEEHIDTVFETANLSAVVMTNNPFDPDERLACEGGLEPDSRFLPSLRIDPLTMDWDGAREKLAGWGYDVGPEIDRRTAAEVRRFLSDWIARIKPLYLAASLAPDYACETETPRGRMVDRCILPICRQYDIPFANMIGVKKLVNPKLRLAGDSVGKGDIKAVEQYCSRYPDNRFLVTMLSRENQHELCVASRKFPNLMVFGCWWFLNDPSIIEELTRERFELLGLSVIPQHSDARVLDQLVYKWAHSRRIIADVLADKYADVCSTGWKATEDEIRRDARLLFSGNFERFVGK